MLKTYFISILSLFLLFLSPCVVKSEHLIGPNLAIANKITDAQVAQIVKQMEEQSISVEEAMNIARIKGASESQINELTKRIEDYKKNITHKEFNKNAPKLVDVKIDETLFSKKSSISPSDDLKQVFGFSFFNTKNLNFASNINTPLPDDYIIGIGDNIQINVYGASQQDYSLQVNNNRAIQISNIGPIYIGGLSLAEARKLIKSRLSSIYGGMQGNNPNTFVSITIGNISGININVIGEATRPGTYSLPANATVFNALYLAGGPGNNGSFRSIDIVRDGTTIANIDIYNYLINGDTRGNIQLRNNDVILVNPYINRIFVKGDFKRQGIFETKPNETLADVIRYAGGFTVDAYNKQINLTRNNSNTLSFFTVEETNFATTPLFNGDKIEVGKVVQLYENRVTISGTVYRPGNYELTQGLTLKKLIDKAGGLKDDTFLERGIITRRLDNLELQTISFSLNDIMNGIKDITLKRDDKILLSSIFDMKEKQTIKIVGAVQNPGTFPYTENLTVSDIIFMAGGFKEDAAITNIEIIRRLDYKEAEEYSENLIHTYNISVDRNLNINEEDSKMLLKPFDYISVRYSPGYRTNLQGSVNIKGEIKYAGSYGITKREERISDIIKRAGGLTPQAYPEGISLRRKSTLSKSEYEAKRQLAAQDSTINDSDIARTEYKTIAIKYDEILKDENSDSNLIVNPGDEIFIPRQLQTIKISGAVLNPISIAYKKGLSVKDYINMSGGFALKAKKNRVYVLYPNGEAHATRAFLFRSYPKVVPGSEIVVPEKPEIDRTQATQRWISIGSSVAGIAASIAALISISGRR